ncbi:MAG: DNA polymerase/3'-5' exonuclease PolX [Gammaproteobacteria bacterium]|jgi:DNA polymerase/3'-5' exonuclease PolX
MQCTFCLPIPNKVSELINEDRTVAGSYRRRAEIVGELDMVVPTDSL